MVTWWIGSKTKPNDGLSHLYLFELFNTFIGSLRNLVERDRQPGTLNLEVLPVIYLKTKFEASLGESTL